MTIADLGEFGLIAAIAARLPGGGRTLVGIGDDAAVLATPDGRVVATTDLLVEGRHFRRDWSSAAEIGGKAAAQNLADVAAMGATPVALLVGFAVPGGLPVAWAEELFSGIAAECARAGATVAGGDVVAAGTITLAITALGDLAGREPVTRTGARPGDVLAVNGVLGHAAAGLDLLRAGLDRPAALTAAHRWPRPPYAAGPAAAALGATAMIDISDGLVQDTGHLAAGSGVEVSIDTALLPAGPDLAAAVSALASAGAAGPGGEPGARQPLTWILTGGEDHALAATFPAGTSLPADWTVIGRIRGGRGVRVDGQSFHGPAGWNHFRD